MTNLHDIHFRQILSLIFLRIELGVRLSFERDLRTSFVSTEFSCAGEIGKLLSIGSGILLMNHAPDFFKN